MRVTNQIMMNNSLANIDTNKNKLMEIESIEIKKQSCRNQSVLEKERT